MLGRPNKFDWNNIQPLLDQKKTTKQIAKELNVTVPAIRYAILMKDKKAGAISTVTFEKAGETVRRHLDIVEQLNTINQNAYGLLDLVTKAINGDKTAIDLLNQDDGFKRKDPSEIRTKLLAEIRGQLELQNKIFSTLYTVQQIDEYQDEVEATMEEMEPGSREKFLKRLKERRLLHSATQWREPKK